MSDTIAPQGEGAAPEPAETEPQAPAPADPGAVTETEPTTETDKPTEEPPKQSRADRRIAALSARLAAQSNELEQLRRARQAPPEQPQAWPQTAEELERVIDQRAEAKAAQMATVERARAFHDQGTAAYGKDAWQQHCTNLQAMGADAPMSELLIALPNGAKVAAALAEDPEELERISAIRSQTGRAIALGQYAATVAAPTRRAAAVSRAPAPIRPVTGAASPRFNEYDPNLSAEALADFYAKQDLQRRQGR